MASQKHKLILGSMVILGLWLAALLWVVSWFQQNYIQSFTEQEPQFLEADHTDSWFTQLSAQLPAKQSAIRVIQLWQPNCLCNRFARSHALSTQVTSNELKADHLTLIPKHSVASSELDQLQTLNPHTTILAVDTTQFDTMPSSPSVFVEGPLSQLHYFGPLGYGAFCSQASTGIIEAQLLSLTDKLQEPSTQVSGSGFYNVIGKGCFCQWGAI